MYRSSYGSGADFPTWQLIICIVFILVAVGGSCSQQSKTRSFGEDMDITLKPNQKLVNITWKDSDLWYLTRPMTEDDTADIYTFSQRSNMGIFSGSVTVYEVKMTDDDILKWEKEQGEYEDLHGDYSEPYNDYDKWGGNVSE